MKTALAIAIIIACLPAVAAMPTNQVEPLADAIYRAEGGAKSKYPYGIIAKRPLAASEARRWCQNTVRNNWTRWEAAGKPGDYLEFLAKRYAPVGASNDPNGLNKNWLKNVRWFLAHPAPSSRKNP